MRILVTGGAGFVGSHLVASLLREGHEVSVLDNFSTSENVLKLGSDNKLELTEGSILNEELVSSMIAEVDLVVHLAAAVGVANIMDSPLRGLETNILGSEIVIRNSSKWGKPIVIASSSEIYGKNTAKELNETSDRVVGVPQKSRWSYSDSKAIEEAFAFAYAKEKGLQVKIVRLFNTVGPGQKSDYGMVVPRMIQAALFGYDLVIHGTGKQTRCFMHVNDAVDGLMKVITTPAANGEVFNLGNPQETSIEFLAQKIVDITKSNSRIVYKDYAEIYGTDFEDMDRRVPDISKAWAELCWKPNIDLDTIISDIVSFELTKNRKN